MRARSPAATTIASLIASAIVAVCFVETGAGCVVANTDKSSLAFRATVPVGLSGSDDLNTLRAASPGIIDAYALPETGDYLAVSSGPDSNNDYGLRFQLLRIQSGKASVVFSSVGMMDSYVLKPMFFSNGTTVLILGETAAEYCWGIVAFEYRQGRLRDFGSINVARPGDDVFEPDSPLPYASVRYLHGDYEVSFATDLVLGPGETTQVSLQRRGDRPHVFRHYPGGWRLVENDN
jgi:hypothetical protein